jgi:predicted MFS family arabinose efflux permease
MGVLAAVGVAVIYVPQPIQTLVAQEFRVPVESSGAATVAVQAGYALGVVLLVSLGDRVPARRQVTLQLIATGAAILAAALAPGFGFFVAMSFVAGATATIGQILVSAALRLAPPEARARTAAVLMGSFILGLFTVRTLLGTLAGLVGWRWVLVGCAVLLLSCVPISLRFSPATVHGTPPGYLRILASIPRVAISSGVLRLMTLVHMLSFGAFITAWSTITVYAVTRLGLSVLFASLLGIAGLLGGALTIAAARLHPLLGARRALWLSLGLLLVGALSLALFPGVLPVVVAGLFLVSLGMPSSQVTSQARALASVPAAESGRANTVFMATTFAGGALATAGAQVLYGWGGYSAVGVMAATLAAAALALAALASRRGMLAP